MNPLFAEILRALLATGVLATVCGGIYPLAVFGLGQAFFRDKADGSLLVDPSGTVRGSRLIGQPFTAAQSFHPRPSAAGQGYDAANSSGSNLGPTSQKLRDALKARIASYREENGLRPTDPVPADAVTASGSGLDPHISVRNAAWQTARVAKDRGLAPEKVAELVRQGTEQADFGILGEARVNVLMLNRALDEATVQSAAARARRSDMGEVPGP